MEYFGRIAGFQLIEAECCSDTVQARTHKKKRINKKWRKRYGTRRVPWKKVVVFEDKIIGHPKTLAKIRGLLKEDA